MRSRIIAFMFVVVMIVLAACGAPSKEDVMKKLSGKWNDTKGYELQATMEIKTGAEPRLYDVTVWHTKPDLYRVHVTEEGKEDSQMIVRNEDGVFVVTPSLGKTYKFQSDWPAQNSQPYLIGALSDDIKSDENATMTEKDEMYIFETVTRNNHKKVLPTQQIYIDKKTLLPGHVSVLDESKEEKIRITFTKITLGTERKASDYAVELNSAETEEEEETEGNESEEQEDEARFIPYYPMVTQSAVLEEEGIVKTDGGERSFMTFSGEKGFTVIQEPAARPENAMAVSVEGDPVDLGFAVAAVTDKSIRWESDGISFFIASENLSKAELIEVASSMSPGEMK
ncbi:LolA family protein [Sporosarcina sp. CAU 1771]